VCLSHVSISECVCVSLSVGVCLSLYVCVSHCAREEGVATHYSVLVWRIPWAKEPGGLQAMGSQRIGHSRATNTFSFHFTNHVNLLQ